MNALANSQREELDKFLCRGFDGQAPLLVLRDTQGKNQKTSESKF